MESEDVPDLLTVDAQLLRLERLAREADRLSVTSAEAKDRKRFARVAAEYRRQARKLKAEPRRA
ncbi:MAG: hypothetical protein EON89_04400 [Brevundimonas sp.]|nr:MAG: hypothetical protein EON89_04400 [Brevundimonas sp.]